MNNSSPQHQKAPDFNPWMNGLFGLSVRGFASKNRRKPRALASGGSLPQLVSVSDFQRNYPALIKRAKESGRPLLVLKKNKLEVVLLDAALYQKMVERIRLFEEKQALEAIAFYEKEKKAGRLKKMKIDEESVGFIDIGTHQIYG